MMSQLINRKWTTLILGLSLLLFTACSTASSPLPNTGGQPPVTITEPAATGTPLANTRWILVSYGNPGSETPVLADTNITLEFKENGQAGGSGGCNSYGAQVKIRGTQVSFNNVTSTLMACDGEGVGEQEASYLQALETASKFEISGDNLKIVYNNGQGALNFARSF